MAAIEFGILILIDGEAGVGPGQPVVPAHPDDPDPPRAFHHTSSPMEIVIGWSPPQDWGNEAQPLGVGRYYQIAYRRDTNPDDQTDEVSSTSYTVAARGGSSLTKFQARAVNAAGRRSRWVSLPELDFAHYTRKYGPQYAEQYA